MHRDKKTKGEITRERLLSMAANEFATHGFHATKISNIVKKSGVTQPVFYSYFKSKEEIYDCLMSEFDNQLEELVVSMLIEASLPKDNVVDNISHSLYQFLTFFYAHYDLTIISLFHPPHDKVNRAKLKKWIARNMVIEQKRGFYSRIIPVETMASCYLGVLIQTFTENSITEDLAAVSRERALFLCHGLVLRESLS
ncbi:TetR/AcrR family transcriptional regulator [Enterobacteriaceae bacterium BIT-l23]|uniref:TetR/AcrR family transcriptional regulator n=1 Tax=Jejubacter sp. L23 TaxID=3092086 RepID=UPI0015850714|nr:TetR/AcrR family transcriptional regulator [Enterobacteriaceae bacterium BIT-l23]